MNDSSRPVTTGARRSRKPSLLPALALPALVWFLAAFFFFGDLGKWTDDYAVQVRDPVTGSFAWSDLLRYQWWFFWRPIHLQLCFFMQTVFWNHDWINHLFSALMHALACLGLWRFLRECGLSAPVSACAAIVMLVPVPAFEAIYWPATVSTTISTAAFFWAARIALRHAQGRNRGPAPLVLGALGFIIPCMYEQPAAALAALPVLYLGVRRNPNDGPSTGVAPELIRAMRRAIIGLTPCAIGLTIYLVLFVSTVRHDPAARESRFVGPAQLVGRIGETLRATRDAIDPISNLGEFRDRGWSVIGSSNIGFVGWGIVALAALAAWFYAWRRWEHASRAAPTEDVPGALKPLPGLIVAAFATSAFGLALLPIAAIGGAAVSPRLSYFPFACALAALAVGMDGVLRVARSSRWFRGWALATLVGAAALWSLFGAVYLVGVQSMMRERSRRDIAEMRHLQEALPNPAPGTIFVPVRIDPAPDAPKAARIRYAIPPVWASPWGVNSWIKHVYHRSDVSSTAIGLADQSTGLTRAGEPTLIAESHFLRHLPQPRFDTAPSEFPLGAVVPITIGAGGEVLLVPEIDARRPDGGAASARFPQAQAARADVRSPPVAIRVAVSDGATPLLTWSWPLLDGAPVKFARIQSWGAVDLAVRMHPPVRGCPEVSAGTQERACELAPCSSPRRLVFYATFDEAGIESSVRGDGVDLVWSLNDASAEAPPVVLHAESLDPKAVQAARSWRRIEVVIPAIDRPRTLLLTVGPGPKGNPDNDRVVVTCGEDATARTPLSPGAKD